MLAIKEKYEEEIGRMEDDDIEDPEPLNEHQLQQKQQQQPRGIQTKSGRTVHPSTRLTL